jgi:hypothetical protein
MGYVVPFLSVTVNIDEAMQEQLEYFILERGPRAHDITVYMTEGGRHA